MTSTEPSQRALTIRQPWAFAVVHGGKRIENRSKPTRYRGPLAIHAGAYSRWDKDGEQEWLVQQAWHEWIKTLPERNVPAARCRKDAIHLDFGAFVATAELTGCHYADDCNHICPEPEDWDWRTDLPCTDHEGPCRNHCSPWAFPDLWHWELANVTPLPRPIPAHGWLGLWIPGPDDMRAITEQQRSVA